MPGIVDRDAGIIAKYSQVIQGEYEKEVDSSWEGSPFAWIVNRSSRQKGSIGEKLISSYLSGEGFDVTRSSDSEADRLINGSRAEMKFSSLWKNGSYRFQQIRDQNYKFCICLGVSPYDVHCYVLPKETILDKWRKGEIRTQHGGADGADTAWLKVTPGNEPEWLQCWGNRLSDAAPIIAKLTGRSPF